MTFCGELRLDGRPAAPETARAMLAASVVPVDPDSVRVHTDGPLTLAGAPDPALGAGADLATSPTGLFALVDGPASVENPARTEDRLAGAAASWLASTFATRDTTCLDDLLGDWLALLWDPCSTRLVLARAVLGWRRPVVYADSTRVVFGTELSHLRAAGVPFRLAETVFAETLMCTQTTVHETMIQGVQRVPGGELLDIQAGKAPQRRSFSSLLTQVPPLGSTSLAASASSLRTALDAAVTSAVLPGGAAVQLSGGLDSSTLTGIGHRLPSRRGVGARLLPVSLVFPGQPHDESAWIAAVEEHLGVTALRVEPGPYDWDRWRAWVADTAEVPPRPNAALAMQLPEPVRAEGLSVVLTGEGGDDWLKGWRYHWPDLLRAGHLAPLWRQSGPGRRPRDLARRVRLLGRAAYRPLRQGRVMPRPAFPWVRPERLKGLGLDDRWQQMVARDGTTFASHDHYGRWAVMPRRQAAPILDSLRLATAAAGIDSRHPFHDKRVVRCALTMPGSTMYAPDLTKRVMRAAAHDALPPAIGRRRGKARFDLEVLRTTEAGGGLRTLAAGPLAADGWIDLTGAESAWEHAAGLARTGGLPRVPQHSLGVFWQLVELDTWLTHAGVQG